MRRLHRRLYLAIVGTLLAFLVATAFVWHAVAEPLSAMWGIETATRMSAAMLDSPQHAGEEREIVATLADQVHGDVALYDDAAPPIVAGRPFEFTAEQRTNPRWNFRGGPALNVQLADGRVLMVHPRQRLLLHGLHVLLILTFVAAMLALLTYPIARGITARLARLREGVQKFGDGDLSARVAIEGRDEVAALATSFNDSAGRVEQLVRANQQLLANCSHELRTPLTRMRLAIERNAAGNIEVAELKRNIAELDVLIGELLLSSRLEAAKGPERVESVDLLALAAEEAAYFDREVTGTAVTVQGDPLLLRRLVRNLVENARLHAGGASDIRVEKTDGGAQLVVEDSGPGVAPEDRERIFEPFHRRAGTAQATGTGLGLSIVRQIARLHGGDVKYESRAGGGSRFVVTL
jgi:two-component system, OmpR family, sensor histidine kinase RstB